MEIPCKARYRLTRAHQGGGKIIQPLGAIQQMSALRERFGKRRRAVA
jgi:hypothetical protein